MKVNAIKSDLKTFQTVECRKCKIPELPFSLVHHPAFDKDGEFLKPKRYSITDKITGIQFAMGRTLKEAKQNAILTVKAIGKENVNKILNSQFRLS